MNKYQITGTYRQMAVLSLYIINIPKIYNKCRSKVRIHILIRCNWDVIEQHAGIVPECLPSTCLALLASAFIIFCFLFFLIVLHDPSCAGHMINNLLYYICITYDSTISWGFIASFKITPSVNLSGPTYISFHCFFFFGYFLVTWSRLCRSNDKQVTL